LRSNHKKQKRGTPKVQDYQEDQFPERDSIPDESVPPRYHIRWSHKMALHPQSGWKNIGNRKVIFLCFFVNTVF